MRRIVDQRTLSPWVGAVVEQDDQGDKLVRLVCDSHATAQRMGGGIVLSRAALDAFRDLLERNGL